MILRLMRPARLALAIDDPTPPEDCPFCAIVAGLAPATIVHTWPDAVAFVARPGLSGDHLLVVPRIHVANALVDPQITGMVMRRAASLAPPDCHLWINVGHAGGQTIRHLHGHIVPRAVGDGLRFAAWDWEDDDDRG